MNVIKVVLKVKSPFSGADELVFQDKEDEIFEAVDIFNDKFRDWSKRIVVTQLNKRSMHLLMVMEKSMVAANLSVREIRSFIQYLRNDKGWHAYTREKNKMFETVEFYKLGKDELISILDKVKSTPTLYRAQKQDIDFMNEVETIKIMSDALMDNMEDQDMMTVLDYLIKTKDKGHKAAEKTEDIAKLKLILSKWL